MHAWLVPILTAAVLVLLGLYLIERQAAVRLIRQERKHHEQVVAALHQGFAMEKKLVLASFEGVEERHRAELERVTKLYASVAETQKTTIQETLRLATTAFTVPQEARVEDRTPDAFERVQDAVRRETIERGVEVLREGYRAVGAQIDEASLREEAEMMLTVGVEARFPDLRFDPTAPPVVPEEVS